MELPLVTLAALLVVGGIAFYLIRGLTRKRDERLTSRVELPPPANHRKAMEVAGRILGLDLNAKGITYTYFLACCEDQLDGGPGVWTEKMNCYGSSVAPYTPQVFTAWEPGMRYSDSPMARGLYQYWEVSRYGFPDSYRIEPRWTSGEAQRTIAAINAAWKDAGL